METPKLQMNAWTALYVVMALFWLYMAYTEATGKWLTMPGPQAVEPEQQAEQEGESHG